MPFYKVRDAAQYSVKSPSLKASKSVAESKSRSKTLPDFKDAATHSSAMPTGKTEMS